jgi:hypothetical protein
MNIFAAPADDGNWQALTLKYRMKPYARYYIASK